MVDKSNLGSFPGLGSRAQAGMAQDESAAQQGAADARSKSWRQAWQRAMEQAQAADLAGWFTGPVRPGAVKPLEWQGGTGTGPAEAPFTAGTRIQMSVVASQVACRSRQESIPSEGLLNQAPSSAAQGPVMPGPGRAGFTGSEHENAPSPRDLASIQNSTDGPLGFAPHLGSEGDQLGAGEAGADLDGVLAHFQFSKALTQALAGVLSEGEIPGLVTKATLGPVLSAEDLLGPPSRPMDFPMGLAASGLDAAFTPSIFQQSELESSDLPSDTVEGYSEVNREAGVNRGEIQAHEPIRLTAESSDLGIRVWLGINFDRQMEFEPELAHLTLHIQQWLASQGEKLISVICNGREVWRDTLEQTKNALNHHAPRPELSAPPLKSRKPV